MKLTSNRSSIGRQLAMAAIAVTLFVGVSQAQSNGPPGKAVADIVATNGGVMELNAKLHKEGFVTGDFTYTSGGGDVIVGTPMGVYLEGNSAYVSGIVVSGTFNGIDVTGMSFNFKVTDNGSPGSTPGDTQGLLVFVNPAAGFQLCNVAGFRAFYDANAPVVGVVQGNVTVK